MHQYITLFQTYLKAGFCLVPIPPYQKGPHEPEWNHHKNVISTPEQLERLPDHMGVGLAHAYSGTCTIDIDQLDKARTLLLLLYGIDLDQYLNAPDAVQIIGNPDNHGKLVFALPWGVILPTVSLKHDNRDVLQFRCATKAGLTVQDVLPPSIHPDTLAPYQWGGAGDWSRLPLIPEALLKVWRALAFPRRSQRAGTPVAGRTQQPGGASGPEEVDIEEIRAMLAVLDPDMHRDEWLRVGMAIHSESPDLFWLWDAWSQRGAKYNTPGQPSAEQVWASFSEPQAVPGEAVGLGTLRRIAFKAGWRAKIDIEALYRAAGFVTDPSLPGPSGAVEANGAGAPAQCTAETLRVPGLTPPIATDDRGTPEAGAAASAAPGDGGGGGSEAPLDTLETLLEAAEDLTPSTGVGDVLVRAVWLTPTEQDRLIQLISEKTTINRAAVRRELANLTRAARSQMDNTGTGPAFPLTHPETGRPLDHVDNLRAFCDWRGVVIQFNEMTHDVEVLSDQQWAIDDWRNQQLFWIRDQMVRWGMPYARSLEHIKTLALANSYHPMGVMLDRARWDGVSRWGKIRETIRTTHPAQRDLYLRRWCLSGIAAVRGWSQGVPPRGVIVFSGEQAQGKTSWLRYLTPRGLFGEGLHLDPGNKDSLKQAVSWWVVELGELDSTFSKSDISRLKAHISKGMDELRLPYAPSESRWPRRTIYAGTVNKPEFLADQTGNTRFWPIETLGFDLDAMRALWESGEILQFWLEVETWYQAGERWWLSPGELRGLEEHNEEFRDRPAIEETLEYVYLWDTPRDQWQWKTPTEIRRDCELTIRGSGPGNQGPENTQFKEALKRLTGQIKAKLTRKGGGNPARKWLMPPKRFEVIMGGREEE